jgi:hypothetical protein
MGGVDVAAHFTTLRAVPFPRVTGEDPGDLSGTTWILPCEAGEGDRPVGRWRGR